jgi:hypothetical protein
MPKQRKERNVYWENKGPSGLSIKIELTDDFDARGKHRVYGRGDLFGRLVLNMDIWRDRNGRLFARFLSRSSEVDWYSYEIFGLPEDIQLTQPGEALNEKWAPECLRDEYDSWVVSEMPS